VPTVEFWCQYSYSIVLYTDMPVTCVFETVIDLSSEEKAFIPWSENFETEIGLPIN
jgi:hypothetical protein